MKMHDIAAIILAISVVFNPTVRADIIDNGSFTTDTETGLDWLDVTESIDESYSDVIKQFGIGGKYEGYRYATAKEFNTLVGHFTGIIISQTQVRQVIPPSINTDKLMQMLGSTQKKAENPRGYDIHNKYFNEHFARMLDSVTGITINNRTNNGYVYIGYSVIAKTQDFGTKIWHYSTADINKYINHDTTNPEAGSFLVRDSKIFHSMIDEELKTISNDH